MRWMAGEPGGAWRAVDIIARTAVSCDERPITVSGHFKAESGSEFEQALHDFQAYGVPFTSPPGAYEGHIDAPGGLGGAIIDGRARVMAVDGDVGQDPVLLLQVVDPNQAVLAAVTIYRIERNSGVEGFHIVFKEQHGIFTFADRVNLSTKWRQRTVTIGEIVGQPISAVHAALHVLADSRHPNLWRLSRPNTPPELGRIDPDIGIGFPAEKRSSLEAILNIVDDLQVIQAHTPDALEFPDLETAGSAQIQSWRMAARILRSDDLVTTYPEDHCVVVVLDVQLPEDVPHPFAVSLPLVVAVGDVEVSIGSIEAWFADGQVIERRPAADGHYQHAIKTADRTVRYRRARGLAD